MSPWWSLGGEERWVFSWVVLRNVHRKYDSQVHHLSLSICGLHEANSLLHQTLLLPPFLPHLKPLTSAKLRLCNFGNCKPKQIFAASKQFSFLPYFVTVMKTVASTKGHTTVGQSGDYLCGIINMKGAGKITFLDGWWVQK